MNVNVLMGLPGSGKSSFATKVQEGGDSAWNHPMSPINARVEIINPDKIRFALTGDAGDQSRNKEVFDLAHNRLRWLMAMNLRSDTEIIFDATNIKKFARRGIQTICAEFDVKPTLIVVNTPFEVCAERNRNRRERVVPDQAMERMRQEFETAKREIEDEDWNKVIVIPDGSPDLNEFGNAKVCAGTLTAIWS